MDAENVQPDLPSLTIYRIRVEGELGPSWMEWFDCMMVSYADGITTITGAVTDQPALFGMLDKILALNLTLISVNRCDAPEY